MNENPTIHESGGVITCPPYFFTLSESFEGRVGFVAERKLYVATECECLHTITKPDPVTGEPVPIDIAYRMKLLDYDQDVMLLQSDMDAIEGLLPDGICRHSLKDAPYIGAIQLKFMVRNPLEDN